MEITQSQRNAAEILVKRIKEKRKPSKDEYKKSVEELFYFILKILFKEIEKYAYPEKFSIGFTVFFNYKICEKNIGIRNLGNSDEFVLLDVTSLKDAKKVMQEVADMFNDLSYYQAEFHPYSMDKRGVLYIHIDV